jgi:hypothetical protein
MDVPLMSAIAGRSTEDEPAPSRTGRSSRAQLLWDRLPHWVHAGSGVLLRFDWLILPIVAAVLAVVTAATSLASELLIDGHFFTAAGCQMLAGHVSAPYSNPWLQSGPLQNSLYCIASKVTVHGRPTLWFGIGGAAAISVLLVGLRLVRRRAGLEPSRIIVAVAAAYITFWGIPTLLSIHLAEALVPVLWVAGALLIRRHPVWAGLVLGAGAGVELWALVAIPLVFAARTRGLRIASAAAAGFAAGAMVIPFAVAGHLAMFHFKWPVMPHTLPALIWHEPASGPPFVFGVEPRILQLVVALGCCALVSYRVRSDSRLLPWAPAMAAEFSRLLLDPTLYTYYWITPELLAAVALVCATSTRQRLVVGAVAILQVAGELDEFRLVVVALSLVLLASAVFGPMRTPHLDRDAQIQPATT